MAKKRKNSRPLAASRPAIDAAPDTKAISTPVDAGDAHAAGGPVDEQHASGMTEHAHTEDALLVPDAHADAAAYESSHADGANDTRADTETLPNHAHVVPATARAIDPGSQLASSQPSWSQHSSDDIRGVLIQVAGGRLLLPNATIAEVLSYAEPEPVESAPEWLLGRFRWRGWQLPLVAFSRLSGIGEDKPGLGSKVIVLKALGGDSRAPYFAVLTQGFPRLVTVSRDALQIDAQDSELPAGVQAFVRLNDEPALLPDLMQIEQRLSETRQAA